MSTATVKDHITCCDDSTALCGADVRGQMRIPVFLSEDSSAAPCSACLELEDAGQPCNPGCAIAIERRQAEKAGTV
jgi:hypothetical protein